MARCREEAGNFVYGPETLEIRRGDDAPVAVIEVPAGAPVRSSRLCRAYGLARQLPSSLQENIAITRVTVSPDGSTVVFEVTDEFSAWPRNLPPEQRQIFIVRSDGTGLRSLGPASRTASGSNFEGFRFSPDGRRIVFNDKGPDRAGHEASQVVVLDIETGKRTQVTRLSPGPSGNAGLVVAPRFVDIETLVFRTTLNADGLHPAGGVFTVRTDGTALTAAPLPIVIPGGTIDPRFIITGKQPAAVTYILEGTAVNPHDGLTQIREVFYVDRTNLLQLTNFRRVDIIHVLLSVDRQRVYFTASADPLGTNPSESCQLFSVSVTGDNLQQVTRFTESRRSTKGCALPFGARSPGCTLSRLFQDPVTQNVAFVSSCDPLGTNPYGVQVFSVRPDATELRQLTSLGGVVENSSDSFAAELIGTFAYPGTGSAGRE